MRGRVCVCVGVWDCALHNQKAKTTVSPQIKRISWRREIEWNSSSSSSGYKKRNKTKDIEIKNSWAPQQKQQQHEALYMTICMHRFIYVHHTIYERVCVCVCTHFNFHFHCGCGSLFLPRQPTIDSSTTKSKYHHNHHHQHHYNNNNKYYETTAMSLMQIFVYSKSNRNRIKTAKKKAQPKSQQRNCRGGSYYWQF